MAAAATNGATKVAEKAVKVGLFRRFRNYVGTSIKNAYSDYRLAVIEVWQDVTSGSIKANSYLLALCGAGVLAYANPDARELDAQLTENCHLMALVGRPIRNRETDAYLDKLSSARNLGQLQHTSLGLVSLVWLSQHNQGLDLYPAQCKHANLPWWRFHEQIVDVGILGGFVKMRRMMENYDINEDEWKDQK